MKDLTGQIFGGYELKEIVGQGGMASIYKGYDVTLSRDVAVKVIPIQVEEGVQETILARFRLEAQAIAALRHRNILTIFSYGEEQGWAYIVMEYVPGGSLKDRVESGQLMSWEQALPIIIPVSEALAFAHARGIIHRDIKPANILMSEDDWPLLADFGLAKMQHSTGSRPNLTMPGQVLGTMAYAAPEQIQEGEIDSRVDIYSLAIVLYELLSGKLPFEGETTFDFLMARLTDPPRPIQEANPEVDPIFVPVIEKALAQEANDRYQTMTEFSQALIDIKNELTRRRYMGAVSAPPERTKTVPRPPTGGLPSVRLRVKASGDEMTFQKAEIVIGRSHRDAEPDLDLGPHGGSKAGVSRRHGRLMFDNNEWFIEDLASRNGTFVNGHRLAPYQRTSVRSGDSIRFGKIELEFTIG